jgi:hypothetical protein
MDPFLSWFSRGVVVLNILVQVRRWWRRRKGIPYEPITRLKL